MARTKELKLSWREVSVDQLKEIIAYTFGLNNGHGNPSVTIRFKNDEEEDFDKLENLDAYVGGLDFEGYNKVREIVISTGWESDPKVVTRIKLVNDPFSAGVFIEVKSKERDQARTVAQKIHGYFDKKKTYNWLLGTMPGAVTFGFLISVPFYFWLGMIEVDSLIRAIASGLYAGTVVTWLASRLVAKYPRILIRGDGNATGRSVRDDWRVVAVVLILPTALSVLVEWVM